MLGAFAGCIRETTRSLPPAPKPPALYTPPADRVLTSVLLDFDNPLDATFVDSPSIRVADDPARAGNRALVTDGSVSLNLSSLVRGRDVGGAWDMVGLRLWSDVATMCEVSIFCQSMAPTKSISVALPARAWANVWLQAPRVVAIAATSTVAQIEGQPADDRFKLSIASAAHSNRLLIDDVALAQSRATASESLVPKTNERWRVARVGPKWVAMVNDVPIFDLPAAPFVADGYRVMESDPTRALFTNDTASMVCIDRTGRLIEDGRAKLDPRVLKFARAIAENASPALIEVVGSEGRIERSLPGDANNDGYDERRGCYAVRAIADRAAVRLTRQGGTVKWPAVEVYDLPPGPVSVWLDGEIIPWSVRADDGRLIVELPIDLERPVELQVRVK